MTGNKETEKSKGSELVKSEDKERAVTLFSDDDNSDSTLRTDLLFDSLDYPSGEVEIDYQQKSQMANGSKDGLIVQSTSNFSGPSYNERRPKPTPSGSSPMRYDINSSPLMHKYKYKYCNRKRLLGQSQEQKEPLKPIDEWDDNNQEENVRRVIEMLRADDDDSDSERKSLSGSPSPCNSERKRSASPTWDENNDEGFRNIYNTSKTLKLANNVECSEDKHNRKAAEECTLDCIDSSPHSPLSPEEHSIDDHDDHSIDHDHELSYGTGRFVRRSTQRLKKKCPCCVTPDKPKKLLNLPKKITKGQLNKKR